MNKNDCHYGGEIRKSELFKESHQYLKPIF